MLTNQEFFLLKTGIVVGSGGLIFGYNVGVISGVVFQLKDVFAIDVIEEGLVVSLLSIGSLCGCIFGGYISDKIGRWRSIQLQNVIYVIGALILASAVNLSCLYAGRFVVGIGCALAAAADVPYLQEVAPTAYRGRLSAMFEVMVVFGALLGSLSSLIFSGVFEGWRIMFLIPSLLAIAQSIALMTLPESPKWLLQNNRCTEAYDALKVIYVKDEVAAEAALTHLQQLLGDMNSEIDIKALVLEYKLPLMLISILMALGQLTGSVVVRNYAPSIFHDAGFSTAAALLFNSITSIVNFGVVVTASLYVDKLGRRLLLTCGFVIAGLGMLILSLGFILSQNNSIPIYLCGCILTSAGFNMGFGPVGWILSAEMFPTAVRGRVIAVSTIVRNSFEFITNFLFLLSNQGIHDYGTFLIFSSFCILSLIFVRMVLVETKELEPDVILKLLKQQSDCSLRFRDEDNDNDQNKLLQVVVANEST